MGVKYTIKTDKLSRIVSNAATLGGKSVEVGVFGENGWLAGIHEYGCNITPKRAKYLTVPCSRKTYGKSAGEFSDLFVLTASSGEKFLARNTGRDSFECLFWLTKSVHIPERSFLRAGHDEHIDDVMEKADRLSGLLADGSFSAEQYLDKIGKLMASRIKEYALKLSSPAKSRVTVEAEGGKANPLFNTGEMIGSITWRQI